MEPKNSVLADLKLEFDVAEDPHWNCADRDEARMSRGPDHSGSNHTAVSEQPSGAGFGMFGLKVELKMETTGPDPAEAEDPLATLNLQVKKDPVSDSGDETSDDVTEKQHLVCEDLSRGKCQLSKPSCSDSKKARPSTENGCFDVPTLKGKHLVCEDLSRGKCQLSKPSCSDSKRARPSTENGFLIVPTLKATLTNDVKVVGTFVRKADKHTQCNLFLCAKMQAEKQRKAAQRVKSTQTLKDTNTKSVQTLAEEKQHLVCEDLSRGKCQLSKPSCLDSKRARPSTENDCLDVLTLYVVPTLKATCATQTDDVKVVGTAVKKVDKNTQCGLVLCAKMQAEKERKAAQRVKSTQTLKDTTTKSVQTLAKGKQHLVCEDLSIGKPQLSKPSCSDSKRARASTENGCLDFPTLKASCATQTDDVEVVGTAVEKAMYALKSVEDLGNLSYKVFNDRFLKKNKLLITDSSLMGAEGYNGDPVSLCLDEDGILSEQVLLCPPKETDLTEYGTLDIGVFIDHTKEFFSKQKVICEGIPIRDPSDVACLPSTVSVHLAPRRHLRSKKCPVWYQSSGRKHMCLHCRQGEASLKAKKRRLGQATPVIKRLRQYTSSKSRLCTLTSSTKKKRLQVKRTVRHRLQKKVDNLMDKTELSGEQSSSLRSVVQTINVEFRETLDEVMQ